MPLRRFLPAALLALLLAACSGTAPTDTTGGAVDTSAPGGEVIQGSFAYNFQPGETLVYDLEVTQDITLHADGDTAAGMGTGELPLDADLQTQSVTTMTYDIAPGPDPDTYEITLDAVFDDTTITGTMNGEPLQDGDAESLAVGRLDPVSVTVVVDSQGNVISGESDDDLIDEALGDTFGMLQGMGGSQLTRPLGPAFPEGELRVGQSWTDEQTTQGPSGPIVTTLTSTVVGTEILDGAEVVVIETVAETEAFEIDLSDFFRGVFEGFAQGGGESDADLSALVDQLRFVIAAEPSTATETSWFDQEAGVVKQAEQRAQVSLRMEFQAPDETTGELAGFFMDMDLDQTSRYTLQPS